MSAAKPTCYSLNRNNTPTRLFRRSGPVWSLSFRDTPSYLAAASMTIRTLSGLLGLRIGWCDRNHCFRGWGRCLFRGKLSCVTLVNIVFNNVTVLWRNCCGLPLDRKNSLCSTFVSRITGNSFYIFASHIGTCIHSHIACWTIYVVLLLKKVLAVSTSISSPAPRHTSISFW